MNTLTHAGTTSSLQSKGNEAGWRTGLANLLNNENRLWWGTRRWLWQTIIWLIIINGTIAFAMLNAPKGPPPPGAVSSRVADAARALILTMGLFAPIGVLVLAQGTIVGEKKSGTAAWVLSKPVARDAVILSKLIAYAVNTLWTMIVIQSPIAYIQFGFVLPTPWPLTHFLSAIGLLSLHLLFYLALALMLGTFFDSYGPVMGISIAVLAFQVLAADNLGPIVFGMPIALTNKLAQPLLQGDPVPSALIPVIATTILTVLCIVVAVWRFRREDF
jgi:ABC-2 type transport system permease protein